MNSECWSKTGRSTSVIMGSSSFSVVVPVRGNWYTAHTSATNVIATRHIYIFCPNVHDGTFDVHKQKLSGSIRCCCYCGYKSVTVHLAAELASLWASWSTMASTLCCKISPTLTPSSFSLQVGQSHINAKWFIPKL